MSKKNSVVFKQIVKKRHLAPGYSMLQCISGPPISNFRTLLKKSTKTEISLEIGFAKKTQNKTIFLMEEFPHFEFQEP
jgi:hypothetical protein